MQNISDSDQRQSHTQLTPNISDSDQRRSTSIPNSPPAVALPSIPTTPIPKVGEIEQPSTSVQGLLRPSVPSFRGTEDDDTVEISQSEEEIQIKVTARQETSYRLPYASTATRTDTPLRDIPQSIQVIPRQLLEDRQITRVEEAADNLAGAAEHQFGLWNSYQLQEGSLRGLGFGLGLYYASDRAAVLPNTDVDLPSYFFRYLRSQKL
jgi:outer membrane receptor protein involved in Fe transport